VVAEEDNNTLLLKRNPLFYSSLKILKMKKGLLFILFGLSFTVSQAQEISDAVRFSQDNLTGTARFRAMSGAFGALGGDLSSMNVNPAGSAVFVNNQIGISLSNSNKQNSSNYFGTMTNEKNSSFDLNQAGAVFVFNNGNTKSNWKKYTLAVNYENANKFDNSTFSAGTNPNNSVANYFLSYANPNATQGGIYLSTLQNSFYENLNFQDQQAFLGYQGYIINPTNAGNPNNDTYTSNVPAGGNYYQEHYFASTGYNGKLSFNAATQYKDKFYFGLNLNSHFTDYRQSTDLYEDNANSQTNGVRSLRLTNDLYTFGSGFSFQIGAIAKVTKDIRFGLAYESPTWYRLTDQLKQTLYTTGYNFGPNNPNLTSTLVDSNYTINYDPYTLQTPGKYTGSLAYIFAKKGLISVDYAMKDYSNTKFTPTSNPNNTTINQRMSTLLNNTAEIRIGAEYRIQQWSLRAGYRNEQSPYKDKQIMGDLSGYSGGFGYSFGATKLDLAYSYAKRNTQQGFLSQGFTDGAKIRSENNNLVMTLLFEL